MSTLLHPRGDYVKFPRLLVLTSTFPRWRHDVEPPFVFELAKRLVTNFEVHVLAPHASGSSRREVMDGIHVHRFRYAPMAWQRLAYGGGILATIRKYPLTVLLIPSFLAAQTVSIAQLVKRYRFDFIHAHWVFPQGGTALLARKFCGRRTKILCTSHGGDLYGLRGWFFEWIKRLVVNGCDHVTTVSHAMRFDILKMNADPRKISVIPMGVDLQERFVPTSRVDSRNSLLFVGRLVQKKGIRYLIEAMPIIRRAFPETKLKIAGDGPDRRELIRLADVLGLHDGVEFLGSVSNQNLARVYQSADVVIFPSVVDCSGDQEGFGLVLVEALGCGCTVVATDLPAIRDIVENGRTGLVVGQRNPEQIAEAVVRLFENPALRRSLAMKGRNHVLKRFDWEAIAQKYAEVIAAMC
jgi:glycosyltransferase involved in cell wall biosynthesis